MHSFFCFFYYYFNTRTRQVSSIISIYQFYNIIIDYFLVCFSWFFAIFFFLRSISGCLSKWKWKWQQIRSTVSLSLSPPTRYPDTFPRSASWARKTAVFHFWLSLYYVVPWRHLACTCWASNSCCRPAHERGNRGKQQKCDREWRIIAQSERLYAKPSVCNHTPERGTCTVLTLLAKSWTLKTWP